MKKLLLVLFLSLQSLLKATIPADFSVLVMDLKYNRVDGVKICEMQQLYGSYINAETFLYHDTGRTAKKFCSQLKEHLPSAWVISRGINHYHLPTFYEQSHWHVKGSFSDFRKKNAIPKTARWVPKDPTKISNYEGFFIANGRYVDFKNVKRDYPGLVVVNEAFYAVANRGCGVDKLDMNTLFIGDEELVQMKPKWDLFRKPKNLHELDQLVTQIKEEIPTELMVIKPRGASEGRGVIILKREDLAETLDYIFLDEKTSQADPDKAYNYWVNDTFSNFLVEAFYSSEMVKAPHLGDHLYDPTMRAIVTFCYDQGKIEIRVLEAHWKLPKKGLDEDASLTDQHKSFSMSEQYYASLDKEIFEGVESELQVGLEKLYRRLLS